MRMPDFNTTAFAGACGEMAKRELCPPVHNKPCLVRIPAPKRPAEIWRGALVIPVFGQRNSSAGGISNFYSALAFRLDHGIAGMEIFSWYHGITAINP